MFSLLCNVKITRRQEMCFILDDDGTLKWSGRTTHAAITFLIDEGESSFELDAGDCEERLLLTARRV